MCYTFALYGLLLFWIGAAELLKVCPALQHAEALWSSCTPLQLINLAIVVLHKAATSITAKHAVGPTDKLMLERCAENQLTCSSCIACGMQPFNPLLKFVLVKTVVFLTFWQASRCAWWFLSHMIGSSGTLSQPNRNTSLSSGADACLVLICTASTQHALLMCHCRELAFPWSAHGA